MIPFFLIGCCIAGGPVGWAVGPGEPAPKLTLPDVRSRLQTVPADHGKPTILVFADREGSRQLAGWVQALYLRFSDRIDIRGVADLRQVPAFLRPAVRRLFRGPARDHVLLDWNGEASRTYAYAGGEARIVVIDAQGIVRWTGGGEASEAALAQCIEAIGALPDPLRPRPQPD